MAKNPHLETALQAFGSWDQAQHHAQQLLDNGEITKAEYNKIKSQAGKAKKKEA